MKKIFIISVLAIIGLSTNAQFTKLHDFGVSTTDGTSPMGDIISDSTFLYGLTSTGGNGNCGGTGCGVIFKIKPDGTAYDTIFNFKGSNGGSPWGSLIFNSTKTWLFGMAGGGATGNGIIFKIKPDGSGYDTLLNFNGTNGAAPMSSLVFAGDTLYGMTNQGGAYNYGVIFKIKPDGTGFDTLMSFDSTNIRYPNGSLISIGNSLYGMTGAVGGAYGNIFKIKLDGTAYTSLHDFGNGTDGSFPYGSLIYDGTYLYGMTMFGGTGNCGGNGCGIIFKIKPDGTGYDTLINFNGVNGAIGMGSLILNDGYIYGMTNGGGINSLGNIFKIMPDGTGFDTLMSFSVTSGDAPYGSLISDGTCLYGMTHQDGLGTNCNSGGCGTIFKYCFIITGTNQLSKNISHVTVYPNPATNNITIEALQKSTIDILNIQGQTILQQQIQQGKTNIDISTLAKGVYILRLCSNDKTAVTKIVKE